MINPIDSASSAQSYPRAPLARQALLLITLFSLYASPATAEYYLANTMVNTNDVTNAMLKAIYMGQLSHWEDDTPVSPCIDVSNKPASNQFFKHRLGKNYASFKRHWTKKVFSGEASGMPRTFKNTAKSLAFLSSREGAICFLPTLPEPLPVGVKNITNTH